MKGVSNKDGFTFADLIDFVDNNRDELDENVPIKLSKSERDDWNLRDIQISLINGEPDEIVFYNYI